MTPWWVGLAAAFLGAVAGGVARYILDRQAQSAEFKAACRVMLETLSQLRKTVADDEAETQMARSTDPIFEQVTGWDVGERRILAQGLHRRPTDYLVVRIALDRAVDWKLRLERYERDERTRPQTNVYRDKIESGGGAPEHSLQAAIDAMNRVLDEVPWSPTWKLNPMWIDS